MLKLSVILLSVSFSAMAFDCISDFDGDGYFGGQDHSYKTESQKKCTKSGGIENTSKYKGDCDYSNPTIFPRAPELSDRLDNDCDKKSDEPEFLYSAKVPTPTDTPLINQLKIKLTDLDQQKLLLDGNLYFQLIITNLEADHAKVIYPNKLSFAKAVINKDLANTIVIRPKDLSPLLMFNHSYSIVINFYDQHHKRIGATSDIFYTVTNDSNATPDQLEQLRTKTTLLALKQFFASQRGEIGTNGSVDIDGTRFGAPVGGSWCDEFYAWIVTTVSNNQGFYKLNPDNVPHYFKDPFRDGIWADEAETIPGVDNSYYDDGRGKWGITFFDPELGDTTTGERGDMLLGPKHIMMFFAFDKVKNIVYTIEGNVGNTVMIRQHKTMPGLEDPLNPTKPRNYLLGIGRLNALMFE